MGSAPYFLFSVDLEDLRRIAGEGHKVGERVPLLVKTYLEFLKSINKKCTFFVVGETARDYPTVVKEIHMEGHEIACHTDRHIPLDLQNPKSFEEDLKRNISSITDLGIPAPIGFRAPSLSLTADRKWVYEILAKNGFRYSSSVLPAKNPLYGWKEFGEKSKLMNGVVEIPITLTPFGWLKIPMGAGIYFRVLPEMFLWLCFRICFLRKKDIVGYFHPYDIDTDQPHIMHPGIKNSRVYNLLMYYNRKATLPRIKKLLSMGFDIVPYDSYIESVGVKIQK